MLDIRIYYYILVAFFRSWRHPHGFWQTNPWSLVADHWSFYLFGQLWSWSSLSLFYTCWSFGIVSFVGKDAVVFTVFRCSVFIRLFDDLKWIEYHLVLPLNGTKSLGQSIWPLRVPSLPHFWRSATTCHMPWQFVLWYLLSWSTNG